MFFEMKRNIGRNMPIFLPPLPLNLNVDINPVEFKSKILTQTVRVPKLLAGAEILPKS